MTTADKGSITVASATAIGVGGMMGAGLYTLVGLASTTAGVWMPLAFLVGGVVSVFSVYSYAKLGAKYPSRGGAAQFLIRCFGDGVIAGGLNVFQFLGWIIAMALYCAGFAGYVRALLPWHTPGWSAKAIGVGLIVAVVSSTSSGPKFVGRSEFFFIAIELSILAVFVVFGLTKADPGRFAENGDHQLARRAVRRRSAVRHLRGLRGGDQLGWRHARTRQRSCRGPCFSRWASSSSSTSWSARSW